MAIPLPLCLTLALLGSAAAFCPAPLPLGPGRAALKSPGAEGRLHQRAPGGWGRRGAPRGRALHVGLLAATGCEPGFDVGKSEAARAKWITITEEEGLAAAQEPVSGGDFVKLYAAATEGAKRTDTVGDIGSGAFMAMAAAVSSPSQAALVVPKELHEMAGGAVDALRAAGGDFGCCTAIAGNVQDLAEGTRLLTYFDVIFADTRTGSKDPCTTLSAATGMACLEGTRIVTLGRRLLNEEGVWGFQLLSEVPLQDGDVGFVWEVERSLKSTPLKAPEAQYQKGDEVRIVGLQKRTELNGSIGIVLEEAEDGVFSVFMDDTCQTIKVRTKNLEPFTID